MTYTYWASKSFFPQCGDSSRCTVRLSEKMCRDKYVLLFVGQCWTASCPGGERGPSATASAVPGRKRGRGSSRGRPRTAANIAPSCSSTAAARAPSATGAIPRPRSRVSTPCTYIYTVLHPGTGASSRITHIIRLTRCIIRRNSHRRVYARNISAPWTAITHKIELRWGYAANWNHAREFCH